MKAVRVLRHGGVEVLTYGSIPKPKIQPDEILVEVKACALNHLDLWVRQGLPGIRVPMPIVPGSDVAGVVAEVGERAAGVKKGDPVILAPGVSCGQCRACLAGEDNLCPDYSVLGLHRDGGCAEYIKITAPNVVPMPESLSFVEAASVPMTFLSAWHMLVTRAKVAPGETVLVLAAGSGVGSAAVQVAKLFGARVIATAGTAEKLIKAADLGADETINHSKKDILGEVMHFTERRGVDVLIEHVGSATWEKSLRCLARNGRLVTCGATTGPLVKLDLRYLFSRQLSLLGSYMGSKAELLQVIQHFGQKKLRPVVDHVLQFKEIQTAHRLLEERKQFGKIVLTPEVPARKKTRTKH